jgi:hypothetical protein
VGCSYGEINVLKSVARIRLVKTENIRERECVCVRACMRARERVCVFFYQR